MSKTIETPALADTNAIEYSPARLRVEAHLMIDLCLSKPVPHVVSQDSAVAPFGADDERLARWIVEKAEEAYQQGIADTLDLISDGRRVRVFADGRWTEAIVLDRAGVTP